MEVLTIESARICRLLYDLDRIEARLAEFTRQMARPDFYSFSAVEKLLWIGRETVHDYNHRGIFAPVRIKGKKYIPREQVDALLKERYCPAFASGHWLKPEKAPAPSLPELEPKELLQKLDRVEALFGDLVLGRLSEKKIPLQR